MLYLCFLIVPPGFLQGIANIKLGFSILTPIRMHDNKVISPLLVKVAVEVG